MPWVKADVGFDGIRNLKITRKPGDGSGESAGCVGGMGDSGRALHPSDEFPQMVSFERWLNPSIVETSGTTLLPLGLGCQRIHHNLQIAMLSAFPNETVQHIVSDLRHREQRDEKAVGFMKGRKRSEKPRTFLPDSVVPK